MKKYLSLILIIPLFLIGCKAPKNAINKKSIPDTVNLIHVTDSLNQTIYEQLNKKLNIYIFESKDTSNYLSYFVIYINDSIESISTYKDVNSSACFESTVYVNPPFSNPLYSNDSRNIRSVLKFVKESGNNYPIPFNNRGHKFADIVEIYHSKMKTFFLNQYTLFYNDSSRSWNDYDYSLMFDKDYTKLQNFLEHSIAYYNAFPEKMNSWPVNIRENMTFLGENLHKNYKELDEEREFWLEKDDIKFRLIGILVYLENKSAEEYKTAQLGFHDHPNMRWFYNGK